MRSLLTPATMAIMLLCAQAAPPAVLAQPPTIDLELPSEAADGGNLAVRLTLPAPATGPRHADGAPLVVLAPGGHGSGSLGGGSGYAQHGLVAVAFLFPGGSDGPFHSDGAYDYRGEACQAALRDVLLFAGGEKDDALGRRVDDIVPFALRTDLVLLAGLSNGGPISAAVLGTWGLELPFLTAYVGWENPTNSQTVAVEVGTKRYDCAPEIDGDGNGIPDDDGKNPYLTGYS
ncbi:MAG: hypothetical protein GF355_09775, partial [Candidatus Eisenbacteria bacterium]|nr:hypothetical protein [Candidatus Eisenbacteria bacterium]